MIMYNVRGITHTETYRDLLLGSTVPLGFMDLQIVSVQCLAV